MKDNQTIDSKEALAGLDFAERIELIVKSTLASSIKSGFSEPFMAVLLGQWCHAIVHGILGGIQNEKIDKSQKWLPELAPGETLAFMQFARSDNFKKYLVNAYCQESNSINKYSQILNLPRILSGDVVFFETGLKNNFLRKICWISIFRISCLKFKRNLRYFPTNTNVRKNLQINLKESLGDWDYATWFSERLTEMLPRNLLEGLEYQKILYKKKYRFKKLFSSDAWVSIDAFKIFAFAQKELREIELVGTPHALNYSLLENFWLRNFETSFLDKYLLWGSSQILDNVRCIPFYSPKYAGQKFSSPAFVETSKPYLVSVAARANHTIEFPYTIEAFKFYLQTQYELIKNLSHISQKKIILRTRKKDRGLMLDEFYSSLALPPQVEIEYEEGSFTKTLNKYSLHITDNTSTTITDAFWANFPTLILVTNSYFKTSTYCSKNFEVLEKVGILHYNLESLYAQIRYLCDDINHWWHMPVTQDAITQFLNNYARGSSNPRLWTDEFLN